FRQNQFGGSLGGPIVIPHLYNGRNKTFFFGDYQGTRIRQASPWVVTVPTAAQRASGYTNFSDLITGQSGCTKGPDLLGRSVPCGTIFDPATTRAVAGGFVRDPFPGNQLSPGRLDP